MKTREEVDKLKRDWFRDPCWDLGDTEDFEEHRDELIEFQQKMEDRWRKNGREQERILAVSFGVGEDGTVDLQRFGRRMRGLFARLDAMDEQVRELEG